MPTSQEPDSRRGSWLLEAPLDYSPADHRRSAILSDSYGVLSLQLLQEVEAQEGSQQVGEDRL